MSYRIDEVGAARSPDFDDAYAALAAEFEPRGELERRDVVEHWLDEPGPREGASLQRTYHLLVARDERGALAGVRDCHVVWGDGVAIVYLAHVLVLPPYRRTGLGALLRAMPLALAERVLGASGMDARKMDLLLAAEMEPATLGDAASAVRLAAYGKDRFAAIAPAARTASRIFVCSTAPRPRVRFRCSRSFVSSVTRDNQRCRRGSPGRS